MIRPDEIREMGRAIFEAENGGYTIDPPITRYPDLALSDAYAVQDAYADLRKQRGDHLTGYKVGATNKAIQKLFGVDQPDFGHLFDRMRIADGGDISLGRLIQPLIEPELAFLLDVPLRGPGVTSQDVLAATREVLACFEIIDSRIHDWRIAMPDTVSDNGSSSLYVLGAALIDASALDEVEVVVTRNGERVETGRGDAVLGHPAASAAWLINTLGSLGVGMEAGQTLLSGSFTTAIKVAPGEGFTAEFTGAARVACSFTD